MTHRKCNWDKIPALVLGGSASETLILTCLPEGGGAGGRRAVLTTL